MSDQTDKSGTTRPKTIEKTPNRAQMGGSSLENAAAERGKEGYQKAMHRTKNTGEVKGS